jgi:hypothetical protein
LIDFHNNLVSNVERKKFSFNFVDRCELDSYEDEDGKRYYVVPSQTDTYIYKSVTTIIDEHSDKTWLKRWKDRVGDAEADAITRQAKQRGTAIHDMVEAYFMGEDYWEGHGTINVIDFNRVVPLLNRYVSNIYGVELPLHNHRLRTAGRTDLVCQWDGVNSIVDFKTSKKEKLQEQLTSYFIQTACYALMFQELYHLTIPQIVVIILVDHESSPSVFVENVNDWVGRVEEMFIGDQREGISTGVDVYNDI